MIEGLLRSIYCSSLIYTHTRDTCTFYRQSHIYLFYQTLCVYVSFPNSTVSKVKTRDIIETPLNKVLSAKKWHSTITRPMSEQPRSSEMKSNWKSKPNFSTWWRKCLIPGLNVVEHTGAANEVRTHDCGVNVVSFVLQQNSKDRSVNSTSRRSPQEGGTSSRISFVTEQRDYLKFHPESLVEPDRRELGRTIIH